MNEGRNVFARVLRLWPLAVFAAVWVLLRIFWLDGDSGIASMWEYGYHVTDEGYYLMGGKDRFLWGMFADLSRDESLTYGYASGMHWLSYLAHLCFGLSTWAWRIPFFIVYLLSACVGFRYVARRSGRGFALAVCLAFSCLPMTIVYERTASNDALIGSMLVLAYVCASGRGVWRLFASALLSGAMVLVKPSVWVLMPIVLAGVIEMRKTRAWWLDAVIYIAVAALAVFGWRGVTLLTLLGEAEANGMSPLKLVECLSGHYPLPKIFDFANHFRGFSAFPRDPSIQILAGVAVLISVLPLAMFVRNLQARKWNGHLLLYVSVPLYVAAVCVMNTIYTHYFLPVLAMLPIVFSVMREDLADCRSDRALWKRWSASVAILAGMLCVALLFVASTSLRPQAVQEFYSRIYNLPRLNVWRLTWAGLAAVTVLGTLAVAVCRGFGSFKSQWWAWALSFFAVSSVAFAAYPASQLAPHIHKASEQFFAPLCLSLCYGGVFVFTLFAYPGIFASRRCVASVAVLAVAMSYLVTPTWRAAACEILCPATHVHAEVAAKLSKVLPRDAVVLGERADQALMSLPIRACSTCLSNSDPLPVIGKLLKKNPDTPLYALVDSQHSYNLKHYREHQKEYRLDCIGKFGMPSFADGKLSDVYLCRIVPLARAAKP